jgi:hypothetical protein
MSEAELKQFLEAMAQVRQANTSSAASARQFLREEGYLTEQGRVARPYSDDDTPDHS